MKKTLLFLSSQFLLAQKKMILTEEIAQNLAQLPLGCINKEYPNKTGHIIISKEDNSLTPKDLHPSFYGCLDWHSSVHGHWLLVRLLEKFPNINSKDEIEKALDHSFEKEKIFTEAQYFSQYPKAQTFERTYGWAWLLKLDEELLHAKHPKAKIWHENLQPLTSKIKELWENYLPKQTYPNRTGVHPNTAFGLSFAIDWARSTKNKDFEQKLIEKSLFFYKNDKKTPAYLEPDGSDFFSPSLQIADLMARILPEEDFKKWLKKFYDKKSIENISKIPIVSDLNDYQTVHLVGLSFSKAWTMKNIAEHLPKNHKVRKHFQTTANTLLENALPLVFQGNYGGSHWLGSFTLLALSESK